MFLVLKWEVVGSQSVNRIGSDRGSLAGECHFSNGISFNWRQLPVQMNNEETARSLGQSARGQSSVCPAVRFRGETPTGLLSPLFPLFIA
jgi:hypothetical protein